MFLRFTSLVVVHSYNLHVLLLYHIPLYTKCIFHSAFDGHLACSFSDFVLLLLKVLLCTLKLVTQITG